MPLDIFPRIESNNKGEVTVSDQFLQSGTYIVSILSARKIPVCAKASVSKAGIPIFGSSIKNIQNQSCFHPSQFEKDY
jgi:hypothetical protein